MTAPDFKVEIAFGSTYATPAASRSWTDVTAYAAEGDEATIGVGRGDEFSTADANSLSLSLNNTDGRFSPGYTSGAYYPNVKIGVPVRVTSTPSGEAASVRFTGYVDDWATGWPGGSQDYAVTTISARSRMARLGALAPLGNVIYEEYKRDVPTFHYQLDNLADAVAGGTALMQTGAGAAVTFEATGPGVDGIQAAQFASGKRLRSTSAPIGSGNWTVECVVAATDAGLIAQVGDGTAFAGGYFETEGGTPGAPRFNQVSAGLVVASSTPINDGAVHHLAATYDGTRLRLYVDGSEADSVLGGAWGGTTVLDIGGHAEDIYSRLTGSVAHVAGYNSALSSTRILGHASAVLTGGAGETAQARLERYAAYAGIPAAEVSISAAAVTPVAHIDTTGQTALALMQKVAETDGGVLYDGRDGVLTYAARTARYTASTAVTLQANQVETGVAPKLDRSALVNEVAATIADGSDPQETVPAKNATSYTNYGPAKQDIELATTDADEAHAAAWWRVNTYGEPLSRIGTLAVALEAFSAADQTTLLGLTIGSRIKVDNWPSQVGTTYADGFFVEGYAETIGAGYHRIEFNVSPATGFDVWTVGDATYGQYDAYPIAY